MPSMTARKSVPLQIESAHRPRQTGKMVRRRTAHKARRCRRATPRSRRGAARAARDRRRRRRRRGRTNRFRTSPRAVRAAGSACRHRTSCRRRAPPLDWAWPLTPPAASAHVADNRRPSRRDAPLQDAEQRQAGNGGQRQMHALAQRVARLQDMRQPMRQRVDDRNFQAEPAVVDQTSQNRRFRLASRSVRAASLCRQSSSAGEARAPPSASTLAPLAASASCGI